VNLVGTDTTSKGPVQLGWMTKYRCECHSHVPPTVSNPSMDAAAAAAADADPFGAATSFRMLLMGSSLFLLGADDASSLSSSSLSSSLSLQWGGPAIIRTRGHRIMGRLSLALPATPCAVSGSRTSDREHRCSLPSTRDQCDVGTESLSADAEEVVARGGPPRPWVCRPDEARP
jgi:hypothetical protein